MRASYPAARPSARRRTSVLAIAPHPDDDAIGCGGTLAALAGRGATVRVVYVTDGSASHVKSKRFPPPVLRDVREAEARAALRRLGITAGPVFFRAPDSGLAGLEPAARATLVARLAARIDRLRADVVFAPWPRDPHPDHVATAAIVADALRAAARRPALYYYGVWLPVRGTAADHPQAGETGVCEIALDAQLLTRKRRAILEHRSQTGALIDDDPDGFVIDAELLAGWLAPVERFFRPAAPQAGRSTP